MRKRVGKVKGRCGWKRRERDKGQGRREGVDWAGEEGMAPNIIGSRPWTFKVTWRHRARDHSIPEVPFPRSAPLYRNSISNCLRYIQPKKLIITNVCVWCNQSPPILVRWGCVWRLQSHHHIDQSPRLPHSPRLPAVCSTNKHNMDNRPRDRLTQKSPLSKEVNYGALCMNVWNMLFLHGCLRSNWRNIYCLCKLLGMFCFPLLITNVVALMFLHAFGIEYDYHLFNRWRYISYCNHAHTVVWEL